MRRERITLATTLSFALTLATSPVSAQETTEPIGGEGDNVAVAIATKDGSSRFKVSFRIVRTKGNVIDNGNVAFAFSSCEGCRSVAIAFQVVLVGGTPTTVIPENYAIALNFECTDCETLASAYQFVMGTDGNVHFTSDGNRALSEIRRAIHELARSDLAIEEIQGELDLLAADLRTVLAEELVASGPPDVQVQEVQGDPPVAETQVPVGETPEAEPSPTPAASSSPEPTSSPSPEGTGMEPSPSPDPSPSPTPSPTPTVTASP